MTDPRHEYDRRIQQRGVQVEALERRASFLSAGRGVSFLLVVAGALGAWGAPWPAWTAAVPGVAFVALIAWHEEVRRRQSRVRRAIALYDEGCRRLDGTWAGRGPDGLAWRREHHPYDEDLDVLGEGSLFQLLCRARTPMGQGRLAGWLLEASSPEALTRRREAVSALTAHLDAREAHALLGPAGAVAVDDDALRRWARHGATEGLGLRQAVSGLVTVALVATLLGWVGLDWGHRPVVAALMIALVWGRAMATTVQRRMAAVESRVHDLGTLADLLAHVEAVVGAAPAMSDVATALAGQPSRDLRALARRLDALEWARNPFFAPFAFVLQWHVQLSLAIEAWRRRHGAQVESWLDAVGEYEALQCLASHAYEHPGDVFCEWLEGPPRIEAEGLAHPLLPSVVAVRNDLTLGESVRLYLVSGSNMSGKSTLLRALGSNVVLAQAGAPVRAHRLRATPLTVAASIRVQDSLLQGASRFRAELVRLRTVLQRSEEPTPLLFLLDEIFHGTHSHDRRIGAQAFLTRLLSRGSIGLVTTHDLALTRIGQDHEDIVNVHFEDHLEAGRMCFDYLLRPGVVEKSNALALMEAEGLIDPREVPGRPPDTTA